MSCLSAAERTELTARLATKKTQLSNLNTTIDDLTLKINKSYGFNSGEGEQRAVRVDLNKLLDARKTLESEIDRINRQLNSCGGLSNNRLRR